MLGPALCHAFIQPSADAFKNFLSSFFPDPKVINAIKWSRGLDRVFIDNYNRDPTLSWQYFGSSAGFMRQYPGVYPLNRVGISKWKSPIFICYKEVC